MSIGSSEYLREELRRSRANDRIHGAYLFEGVSGSGPLESAVWWTRLLLCQMQETDPCERCPDCRKTSPVEHATAVIGPHPDLAYIEADGGRIKVDQVRALHRHLSLLPSEGGWRVALINGAENLRTEAANALLKLLEEPPSRTTLLLVASQSSGLPLTVRSRTTRLRFAPLPEETLSAGLQQTGLDTEGAWLAAALGGGSLENAQAWAEQHLEDARALLRELERIPQAAPSEALEFAESFRGGGPDPRERALLLLEVHAVQARHEAERAAREARTDEIERWLARARTGSHMRQELLRRNLNPRLVVEGLLLDPA